MKPNIILITIDALRADHLGYMGYNKNITPNIDKLSKESVVFTNAYSTGPVTPHSFPGILTSTYPFDYNGPAKIDRGRILISEVLKSNGYITAAFHSNPYLSDFLGFNKGWDYFEDISPSDFFSFNSKKNKTNKINLFLKLLFKKFTLNFSPYLFFITKYLRYRITKNENIIPSSKVKASFLNLIAKEFINSLNGKNKSFFLWIHYMDVHDPYLSLNTYLYNAIPNFWEYTFDQIRGLKDFYKKKPFYKFIKNHLEKCIELYDEGIGYLDSQIGDLLKFLKDKQIYNKSIIILTADHGDEFFEHEGFSHLPKLYNELLHVPLLIKLVNNKPLKINKTISLIDLSPTICSLIEISIPKFFKGRNLFENQNLPIFYQTISDSIPESNFLIFNLKSLSQCKLACQFQGWKYIIDYGTEKEELYNLISDPKETKNLLFKEINTVKAMKNLIEEFIKNNPPFLE